MKKRFVLLLLLFLAAFLIIFLIIFLVGRGEKRQNLCGDGICDEVEESSGKCPGDCGAPATTEPTTTQPTTTQPTTTQPATTQPATTAAGEYWIKSIGGNGIDYAPSFQIIEGGYAAIGYSESFGKSMDVFFVEIDESGNLVKSLTIGGDGEDKAYGIEQTDDGGYILNGYTNSFGAGKNDIFIIKLDSEANVEWARAIGGEEGDGSFGTFQIEDGYLIAGPTESFGERGILLVKLDTNGNLVFGKFITHNEKSLTALGITKTNDGGYAIIGNIYLSKAVDNVIIKLDRNYDIEWAKAIGNEGVEAANWDGIRQTSDGGYLYAVKTGSFGAGNGEFMIVKLNSDGEIDWMSKAIGGESRDAGWASNEISDGYIAGGLFGVGVIERSMGEDGEADERRMSGETQDMGDILLTKLDRQGNFIWTRIINGKGVNLDELEEVKQIEDVGYIMVGVTGEDLLIAKVNEDGLIDGCNNIKTPSFVNLKSELTGDSILISVPSLNVNDLSLSMKEVSPIITSVSPKISTPEPVLTTVCYDKGI